MRRTGACHRAPVLCLAASFALAAAAPVWAADVEVQSDTIVRYFQRDTSAGDDQAVAPVYEYLRVAAGQLEGKGFSVHGYGWGRYDLADNEYFDDRSQGEVLYGYLQYSHETANFIGRLGRQYVFEGVANESVDGLSLRGDLSSLFSVSAYGGQPVALETTNGRSGDRIWGGRLSHHWGTRYDLGLSYKRIDDDSEKQEELLGVDSSLNLPTGIPVSFHGLSVRNMETDQWQEHSYEARVSIAKFLLRPHFERFVYDAYFDTGDDTGSPFRFLADSDEVVTIAGGDLTWYPTESIELELKGKKYNYQERDDNAWYYGALATIHVKGLSQFGLEAGVMDGDTDDTRYSLWRGFLYWDLKPAFVSGDVVYVKYDEDILDEDRSLFASLGTGMKFLDETLTLKLSGDYSTDPYFDQDVRGLLAVTYLFSK
ncbi:MAG: hypothetical protein IH608_07975 [Proteobacteria bacterium]|nr:hypothetical protein [Pseudomonadota bacterium]